MEIKGNLCTICSLPRSSKMCFFKKSKVTTRRRRKFKIKSEYTREICDDFNLNAKSSDAFFLETIRLTKKQSNQIPNGICEKCLLEKLSGQEIRIFDAILFSLVTTAAAQILHKTIKEQIKDPKNKKEDYEEVIKIDLKKGKYAKIYKKLVKLAARK